MCINIFHHKELVEWFHRWKLTNSRTSAILQSTSVLNFFNSGTDLRNSTFSSILWRPVRIMICWKARLSRTHTREFGFIADVENENLMMKNYFDLQKLPSHKKSSPLIDAVLRQLYKIANSPNALPADNVPKTWPPTSISYSPSADT